MLVDVARGQLRSDVHEHVAASQESQRFTNVIADSGERSVGARERGEVVDGVVAATDADIYGRMG